MQVARRLEQSGAHALVLSGGFVSKAPMYVMRGEMPIRSMTHYMTCWWLKYGVRMVGKWMIPSVPFKEAYFLEDALKFRAALKIPLVYVGGLVSRDKIDEVLDDGFEAVQMARALLNEPGLSTACVPKRMHVATAGIVIIALPGCIPSRWHAISI